MYLFGFNLPLTEILILIFAVSVVIGVIILIKLQKILKHMEEVEKKLK